MKRKFLSCIMLLLTVGNVMLSSNAQVIHANTNKPVIVFTKYYLGNASKGYINQGFHVYLNNETVFCIDPYSFIDRKAQYHANGNIHDIDDQIQKIAYFGYYYPQLINDPRFKKDPDQFYINTQAMIWEHKGVQVKVSTPNYLAFKQAVNHRLATYNQQVSFNKSLIKVNQDTVLLKDRNHVLKYYDIVSNNSNIIVNKLNNDTLKVKIKDFNKFNQKVKMDLYKYRPMAKVNIIYKANQSQTLSKLGYINSVLSHFQLINNTKIVTFNKIDDFTKQNIVGVTFNIYDDNNRYITSFVSQKTGVKFRLIKNRQYLIKEAKAMKGYKLMQPMHFIVDEHTNQVILINQRLRKNVAVAKMDSRNRLTKGADLAIYHHDKLIKKWHTTNKVENLHNLVYGEKYCLVETQAPAGYDYAKDINFTVGDKNNIKMIDKPITGTIIIHKKDKQGRSLNGCTFDLIDLNTHRLIKKVTTKDKVSNLDVTHCYQLVETKAPQGYYLGSWNHQHLVSITEFSFDWQKVQDYDNSNNEIMKNIIVYDDQITHHSKVESVACGDKQTNLLFQQAIQFIKKGWLAC